MIYMIYMILPLKQMWFSSLQSGTVVIEGTTWKSGIQHRILMIGLEKHVVWYDTLISDIWLSWGFSGEISNHTIHDSGNRILQRNLALPDIIWICILDRIGNLEYTGDSIWDMMAMSSMILWYGYVWKVEDWTPIYRRKTGGTVIIHHGLGHPVDRRNPKQDFLHAQYV